MNTKLFKKLAEQAGIDLGNGQSYKIENFADLVADAEREACAKVCDDLLFRIIRKPHCFDMAGPKECAEFIRARGNE